MAITIDEILKTPFCKRSKEDQKRIILQGKPRPELTFLVPTEPGKVLKFAASGYEKELYLTACDKRNTFFCWACLLFANGKSVWSADGFSDRWIGQMSLAISIHNISAVHIKAVLQLQVFVCQNIPNGVAATNVSQVSDTVAKNRRMLKLILDVTCHLVTQAPPSMHPSTNLYEYVKQSCSEVLGLCESCEVREAIDFVKNRAILIDIPSVLMKMMKANIREEMKGCNFVSVILSKHWDASGSLKPKLSVVVRYVNKDRKVRERFTRFVFCKGVEQSPFLPKRSASVQEADDASYIDAIVNGLSFVLEEYGIEQKLVSFSCDGNLVPSEHLQNLTNAMHSKFSCVFVPCHFHPLSAVLEQSLCQHPEGAVFKTLGSIKMFLQSSRKMRFAFADIIRNLDLAKNDWDFASVVLKNRKKMVKLFKSVVHNPSEWTTDDVMRAMGLYKTLEEFETIFALEIIFLLSKDVSRFERSLKATPVGFLSSNVDSMLKNLSSSSEKDFGPLWKNSCSKKTDAPTVECSQIDNLYEDLSKRGLTLEAPCRQLFEKIMTTVFQEISGRYTFLKELAFLELINGKYWKELDVPKCVESLVKLYGKHFVLDRMMKELKATELIIAQNKQSAHKLLEVLSTGELKGAFENVSKVTEMALTMPFKADCEEISLPNPTGDSQQSCISASLQCDGSTKIDLINSWSKLVSLGDVFTNAWCFISIEQDIFSDLISKQQFFEEFLYAFQAKSSALPLT